MITNSEATLSIYTLINPAIEEKGFEIIRIRLLGKRERTLQIMLERPDGSIQVEDCARLSRIISPMLETLGEACDFETLEVSSPGLTRPLTREKDFLAWADYDISLKLRHRIEGKKNLKGVLAGFKKAVESGKSPSQESPEPLSNKKADKTSRPSTERYQRTEARSESETLMKEDCLLVNLKGKNKTVCLPLSSVESIHLVMGEKLTSEVQDRLQESLQNQEQEESET